jgi:hypothetical protein
MSDSRFDYVNVRTWNTVNNPGFPEIDDSQVRVQYLDQRPSFGIAFSGGGTRSATATLGQLRALRTLGWLDQARYISANSGGTWTTVPFTYLPRTLSEDTFFGSYTAPDRVTDDYLKGKDSEQSMESMIIHSRLLDWRDLGRLAAVGASGGDESYANFVGRTFLERFGLHDREKFFSHETAINSILEGNARAADNACWLEATDFYLSRKGRPFMIVVGTLLSPDRRRFLVEATPLYVGVRNSSTVATDDGKQMPIGGGFVEPFGYDSKAPEERQLPNGRWRVKLKGGLHRDNLRYRFTLSDMIGMSSAAPAITLAERNIHTGVFPEFRHWAVDRQRVEGKGLVQDALELKHGDGGDIDNLALLPLLARKVENILVFINTRVPFAWNPDDQDVSGGKVVDDLVSLFLATDDNADIVVFEDGKRELTNLCAAFYEKKSAGRPLIHCQRYPIRDNPAFGIKGEKYAPNICWVYLDRSQDWINALPDDQGLGSVTVHLKNGTDKFADFPHYKTFLEHGNTLIDLDRERVRALADLTAWTVFESASYIAEGLRGASLRLD